MTDIVRLIYILAVIVLLAFYCWIRKEEKK